MGLSWLGIRRAGLALLVVAGVAGCVALRGGPTQQPFQNPHLANQHGGFWGYASMRLFGDDQWASVDPERYQTPVFAGPPPPPDDRARVTWVGHATVLIEYRGLAILTDPIWSKRASPVQWLGPARFSDPGIAFEDLPSIDAVVISHDHYDHLDRP
ncbi:MAG: MBL fold metallo-hydrolase, partial [Pseudomonadales bacterium]